VVIADHLPHITGQTEAWQSLGWRIEGMSIVELAALVEMKLNSFRDKDRTHLRDMIQIGLIDSTWPERFAKNLGDRLQVLLDDLEG